MKARLLKTGEIIDFKGTSINFGTSTWIDSKNILHQERIPDGGLELLETTEPIDWEQRRYEIAKEAMGALTSVSSYQFSVVDNYYEVYIEKPEDVAKKAVEYADELISELKRISNEQNNQI